MFKFEVLNTSFELNILIATVKVQFKFAKDFMKLLRNWYLKSLNRSDKILFIIQTVYLKLVYKISSCNA